MKITIAGAGAMGCRFGAALFAGGHEVLLLDGWAGHAAAISAGGLRVTGETGTRTLPAALFRAAADPADLVIVFAKATATATVAAAAAGLIGPSSLLLTLRTPWATWRSCGRTPRRTGCWPAPPPLAPSCSAPGHIRALGSGETVLGLVTRPGTVAAGLVGSVLAAAGIPTRVTDDALAVIWAKVAFNCVMNSLCAIASIPVSPLALYDGFDALALSILDEIEAVARAEGVTVDPAAALRLMEAQFDRSASGDHLASTLQDLMNGRPTEIAHLQGAVAARAVQHGIAAPANALITALIQFLEAAWPRRVSRLRPDGQ